MKERKLIRVNDVMTLTSLSRTRIWHLANNDEEFPKPIKLSPRVACFVEEEVLEWIESQIQKARSLEGVRH